MNITIGYLGPQGSYSEAACESLYPKTQHPSWIYRRFDDLLDLINAIENGEITLGLLPTQNSKSGILQDREGHEFLTRLIKSSKNLHIVGEKFWVLHFILMGQAGSAVEKIQVLHLNPYAQEQCVEYLRHHPQWHIKKHKSSAEAAKETKASNDPAHAAIASPDALRTYQLQPLDKEVCKLGDEPVMHFLALSVYPEEFAQHENKSPLISSFVINLSMDEINRRIALTPSLKISMLRESGEMPHHSFLDLQGQYSVRELSEVFGETILIKWIGTYIACSERTHFRSLFRR